MTVNDPSSEPSRPIFDAPNAGLPVAVFAYKRVERARAVLGAVHRYRPTAIVYVVDGPKAGDEAAVAETREAVDKFVWDCPVVKVFRERNQGVRSSIEEGLDLFFARYPRGVILEEDCFPSQDFFRFAEVGLGKYQSYDHVGMIAGTNFLSATPRKGTHGLFSEGHIWGWGSWADRWFAYRTAPVTLASSKNAKRYYGLSWPYRRHLVRLAEDGTLNSWAIPWLLFLAETGRLCLIPTVNLVTNTGHDISGTHTSGRSRFAGLPLFALGPEVNLPNHVTHDRAYQSHYAIRLSLEHLLHTSRRPLVQAIRKYLRLVPLSKRRSLG
jgi:hypothetical protein